MRAAYYEQNGAAREVLQVADMETPKAGSRRGARAVAGLRCQPVRREEPGRIDPQDRVLAGDLRTAMAPVRSMGSAKVCSASRLGQRVWIWNGQWRRPFGTAAQSIVLPAEQAVPLPADVSMEAGACLGIPAYTGYQGVTLTGAGEGSTVLVAGGAGAVGHYAIQFAKKRGATVIATVSSAAKAELARQAGAAHVIDYRRENVGERVMAITGKRGVDAVIEVDLAANARLLPDVLAPNGIVAIYGSGAPQATIPFVFLLQNSIELKFFLVYQMAQRERERATAEITRMLERGQLIHNVAQSFDLDDIVAAHETVEAGTALGNIVIRIA